MFFRRSYEDIYRTIIQDIIENTPVTNFTESSTAGAIAESIATRLSELYATVDAYSTASYITTAVGESLDNIGAMHGVTRHQASLAYSGENNLRFFVDPRYTQHTIGDLITIANDGGAAISSIVIRRGTTVSTPDGGVSYTTTADATLSIGGIYVPVIATATGRTYNVGIGALTRHNIATNQLELRSIGKYIACSNDEPIETGRSYELDSDYRARIMMARMANANANRTSVLLAARSVPGVADVILGEQPEGPGTFNVVVITKYAIPNQTVLSAVQQAVSNVSAYGMRPIITTPEMLAIELKVALEFQPEASFSDRADIKMDVRNNVIRYTNNLPVGGEWVANEIIQRVMGTSDLIKDMYQEYMRVLVYNEALDIHVAGKSRSVSTVNKFRELEGAKVLWTNLRCKASNPPQKFLMLGKHLVVC